MSHIQTVSAAKARFFTAPSREISGDFWSAIGIWPKWGIGFTPRCWINIKSQPGHKRQMKSQQEVLPPCCSCEHCGIWHYILCRAQKCGLAKAEDDGSSRVADLFDICALEQRESPHKVKTWKQMAHFWKLGKRCASMFVTGFGFLPVMLCRSVWGNLQSSTCKEGHRSTVETKKMSKSTAIYAVIYNRSVEGDESGKYRLGQKKKGKVWGKKKLLDVNNGMNWGQDVPTEVWQVV